MIQITQLKGCQLLRDSITFNGHYKDSDIIYRIACPKAAKLLHIEEFFV